MEKCKIIYFFPQLKRKYVVYNQIISSSWNGCDHPWQGLSNVTIIHEGGEDIKLHVHFKGACLNYKLLLTCTLISFAPIQLRWYIYSIKYNFCGYHIQMRYYEFDLELSSVKYFTKRMVFSTYRPH